MRIHIYIFHSNIVYFLNVRGPNVTYTQQYTGEAKILIVQGYGIASTQVSNRGTIFRNSKFFHIKMSYISTLHCSS